MLLLEEAGEVGLRARAPAPWRAVATTALLLGVAGLALALSLAWRHSPVSGVARPSVVSRRGLSSLPLAAQATISGALGADQNAYRVSGSGGGYRALNPAQRLRTRFDRTGALVESGAARLGLSLSAVGYGVSLTPVGPVRPLARANRVIYRRPGLSEWYANGPAGLEQGFTIARAPAGGAAGPLTLSLALSGDLHAALAVGGQRITFSGTQGSLLRYSGLFAEDARRHALRSWLELRGGRALLRVDARGASYPLQIDPLIQQGPKIAGEGFFGCSVALSSNGNTALIGAENADAAWVFTRTGSTWSEQAKLTGSGASGESRFGTGVALSADGNTALVGGEGEGKTFGAAWVFTRSEGKWTQQGSALTGGKEESGAVGFGAGVALSAEGNTALIGDYGESKYIGAAWVFTRSEGKWTQQGAKLTGGKEEVGEGYFGLAVALGAEGSTALIGAKESNGHVGAAWVFTRNEGKWTQQGSVLTGGTEENNLGGFGSGVALSPEGNTALVGAYGDSKGVGAAWLFTRKEGKWIHQGAKLTGGTEEVGAGDFGSSVALSSEGNVALIGAEEDNKLIGAVWVFTRSEGKWNQQGSVLTGGKEESGNGTFGSSVALSASGETALIGGAFDNSLKGAAWVFAGNEGGASGEFSPEESYGPGSEGEPNLGRACGGAPVNCATGNRVEAQSDLEVGGRGPGLRDTRTYNSQLAVQQSKAGPFGYGWTGSYSANLLVNEAAETAVVHEDDGSAVTFDITPTKTYIGVGGWVQATLLKEGSSYVYTLPDQTKLLFNGAGHLTSETDRNGNTVTLAYNGNGQLETATDGAGRTLTFAYNKEGFVESAKDPMGHTVKYTYELEQLASVTEPGEEKARWKFGYDGSHQMTSETDGREHTTKTGYDASRRVISQVDPLQRKRTFKYAQIKLGSETTITEPNNSTTVQLFNSADLPTSVTEASGSSLAAASAYAYDGSYNLRSVADPDDRTTEYGYDASGNQASVRDAAGNQTKRTYDGTHDVQTVTAPKGETTTIKRDSHGSPLTVEQPAPGGATQRATWKYDAQGDIESETDPLERTRTFTYDKAGDRESETGPAGDEQSWGYNEDSRETSSVSPPGHAKGAEMSKYTTKIELDAQGRPLTVTDPLGHTTKYTYDADGDVETVTDGNGHTTTQVYNADNQPTTVKEPNGTVTETGYDSAGRVASQTNGNKNTTKYVRNALEEVTEEADPLNRIAKDEYDPAGNLKSVIDPMGRKTKYIYEADNRLAEVSYSEEKTHADKYVYNEDGDPSSMTDGTGTASDEYDQLDRLTGTTNGNGEHVAYGYDLADEQTKLTYPNKDIVTSAYDKDGRLESVTDWLKHATKFTYNLDSDLTATTFPSETGDVDKYGYNEADQMTEVDMVKGAETLALLNYTRDDDGQLMKTTSKGLPGEETSEDAYDENNRLKKGGTVAYEYDPANNPKTLGANTYTYDSAGELETGAGGKYSFDKVGERTTNAPAKGPTTTYGYDQAGNLTSVARPAEGITPKIEDSYTYDGNGLRASQTISGTTTHMAWGAGEELLSDGTNSYIYGPGGLSIEQINGESKVLYLHHDQQGSTRMLTGSAGSNEGAAAYDAYGNPTKMTGKATTPLGYDGQYTSADTGLIYLRARVYDPQTEFLSVDPLEGTSGEPYDYAGDNPANAGDPTGSFVSELAQQPPTPPTLPASPAPPASPGLSSFRVLVSPWQLRSPEPEPPWAVLLPPEVVPPRPLPPLRPQPRPVPPRPAIPPPTPRPRTDWTPLSFQSYEDWMRSVLHSNPPANDIFAPSSPSPRWGVVPSLSAVDYYRRTRGAPRGEGSFAGINGWLGSPVPPPSDPNRGP